MSDEMTRYVEACEALGLARANAVAIVAVVQQAARDLQNWKTVQLANVPGASNGPGYPFSSQGPTINAQTWPTAEAIHAALVTFHAAHFAAEQAFNAIPIDLRKRVHPPGPK